MRETFPPEDGGGLLSGTTDPGGIAVDEKHGFRHRQGGQEFKTDDRVYVRAKSIMYEHRTVAVPSVSPPSTPSRNQKIDIKTCQGGGLGGANKPVRRRRWGCTQDPWVVQRQ